MLISAIGTANPEYCQQQDQLIDFMKDHLILSAVDYRFLKKIYKATGIQQRYSVLNYNNIALNQSKALDSKVRDALVETFFSDNHSFPRTKARMMIYKTYALELALKAINNCLKNIPDFKVSTITHIITVSCTGMYAPGLDIELVEKLNLSSQTHRTCINFMGCYGVFSALKMAKTICQSNAHAKVLIVSVEICSIHLQKTTDFKDNIVASALFGDGAAAAIIENKPSSNSYLALNDFYCDLISEGKKDMAWEIGDFGFEINLSSYLPKLIELGIKNFMQNALKQIGLDDADIHYYAVHPGSQKILETFDKTVGVARNKSQTSYDILKQYGNMSSATILFVLKNLWAELKAKRINANIFSCGFGPGLTIESMMIRHHYRSIH